MSQTTGIVLVTGAVTIANASVLHDEPFDWRVPVATAFTAMGFSLFERAWLEGAKYLAWGMFLTVILTRIDPGVPSPAESLSSWWDKGRS